MSFSELIAILNAKETKDNEEKALRMLQSGKIVSVKSLQENKDLYVKAMVKRVIRN